VTTYLVGSLRLSKKKPPSGRLFLDLLVDLALPGVRVVLLKFKLALNLLLVLPGKADVVGLGRLDFYEMVLGHPLNLPDGPYLGNRLSFLNPASGLMDLKGRFPCL